MTAEELRALAPALEEHLGQFQFCCADTRTFAHFGTYVRGLLSELERKSVEPIALAAGTAVRTLQEFLRDSDWDHEQVCDLLQRRAAATLAGIPDGGPHGTIGLIDETSVPKKGKHTPGVQRQHCGALGKTENCIVTVHLGVARGRYKTLLDGELYLPKSWSEDRPRCKKAGIPDGMVHRPKWKVALGQVDRALKNGVSFDWMTFDEGYGQSPAFLRGLDRRGLRFVGEVPKSLSCRLADGRGIRPVRQDKGQRACEIAGSAAAFTQQPWQAVSLPRQTLQDQVWHVKAAQVWLSSAKGWSVRTYWLLWARNEQTGEEKYFLSNAAESATVAELLGAAFTRWNVEHAFRLSKGELGLAHYEGRNYLGLQRHLVLCLVAMAFVAEQTQALQKKRPSHARAGVSGPEGSNAGVVRVGPEADVPGVGGGDNSVSPGPQRSGAAVTPEGGRRKVIQQPASRKSPRKNV